MEHYQRVEAADYPSCNAEYYDCPELEGARKRTVHENNISGFLECLVE